MPKVFIGWGGNKSLAEKVAEQFRGSEYSPVFGGGTAVDMYIGNQIINQMRSCGRAILLVEEYEGKQEISPNLLFEWGYLAAYESIRKSHVYFINCSQKFLPTDLAGAYGEEMTREDGSEECENALAERIYEHFLNEVDAGAKKNYFDIINEWSKIKHDFADGLQHNTVRVFKETIVFGCLAAYYYGDNKYLREQLNHVNGPDDLNMVVMFAKAYVDLFLKSKNMALPLNDADYFNCVDVFKVILARTENSEDNLMRIIYVICNVAYGLSCTLYLKNEGLDEMMREECKKKSFACYQAALNKLDELEGLLEGNKCFFLLMRAYIYNDVARLYDFLKLDDAKVLEYLGKSVEARKNLHLTFKSEYPENEYLITKFEQEYMIALSSQCIYMKDSFDKAVYVRTIRGKYAAWKAESEHTSSLMNRLENNLKRLEI